MKKLLLAAVVALGLSGAAAGIAQAYPPAPAEPTVTVSSLSPVAGSSVTVSFDGCPPGDTATFVLGAASASAAVQNGVATATLPVPSTTGVVTGTISCASGAPGASFEVTVLAPAPTPAPGLPSAGASGITQTLQIALILLVLGGGIFGVTQVRRRQTVDA